MTQETFESIGPEHPISRIANALSDEAVVLAARTGLSRWDLCVAMANAIGHILADSGSPLPPGVRYAPGAAPKTMPRDAAMRRLDDLRVVMESAYDLRDVRGSG
jgi:hypothetical protein